MISAGSRPSAAQCSASTPRSRVNSSIDPLGRFQCWATRATVRRVRRSPRPPMQIGGWGCWTGLGSQ